MNSLELENKFLKKQLEKKKQDLDEIRSNMDRLIDKEVRKRVYQIEKKYKKQLKEKDEEIKKLQEELKKEVSKNSNNSYNSGLPTSQTKIGEQKYVPNTRQKTGKKIGGQVGHKRHQLEPFDESKATKVNKILPSECSHCHGKNLIELGTYKKKQSIGFRIILVREVYDFKDCKCSDCGRICHAPIPNNLKESCQYDKSVGGLGLNLINEIYVPLGKASKLISDMTDGEIKPSEAFLVKNQKKAYDLLKTFENDMKNHLSKSKRLGWDDTVIFVGDKRCILRTYCNDDLTFFVAHDNKSMDSIEEDGILTKLTSETIVMHDHVKINYNIKFCFGNAECSIHLVRRVRKMEELTNHDWEKELVEFISKTIHERKEYLRNNNPNGEYFTEEEIQKINERFDEIVELGIEEFKNTSKDNIENYAPEELSLLNDIKEYKNNYLMWVYDPTVPTTNNACERALRPIKSKQKISGQFKNLNYAKYYARIRSYLETCKKSGVNELEACEMLFDGKIYSVDDLLKIKANKLA